MHGVHEYSHRAAATRKGAASIFRRNLDIKMNSSMLSPAVGRSLRVADSQLKYVQRCVLQDLKRMRWTKSMHRE
jgi:hypothetical protein